MRTEKRDQFRKYFSGHKIYYINNFNESNEYYMTVCSTWNHQFNHDALYPGTLPSNKAF